MFERWHPHHQQCYPIGPQVLQVIFAASRQLRHFGLARHPQHHVRVLRLLADLAQHLTGHLNELLLVGLEFNPQPTWLGQRHPFQLTQLKSGRHGHVEVVPGDEGMF